MMKKIITFSFIFILCTTRLLSNDINILNFDVAGIKLKMDPKTVIQKLKSKYHLKNDDIIVFFNHNPFGKKYKKNINLSGVTTIKSDRGISPEISVDFCISEANKKSEVETVYYSIPGTQENKKKIQEAAIKKYGKPTISHKGILSTTYIWCNNNEAKDAISCKQKDYSIYLKLVSTSISLYSSECSMNNIKIREKRNNTTPNF